jgi:hypothetical protein
MAHTAANSKLNGTFIVDQEARRSMTNSRTRAAAPNHAARSWMERVTGIEPALSAWEADVLPLNYTRVRGQTVPGGTSLAVPAQTSYRNG